MNDSAAKKNSYGLKIAAALAGFCVMVIELTATRLLAPYVGSSLYTWTSAIGILLAGMAVGNYFGGRIIDVYPVRRTLGLFFIAAAVTTLVIPMLAYFSPVIALSQLPLIYIVLTLSMLLFFIPAVCFGTLYPAIMRLYVEQVSSTGERSGQISAAWTVGSIIGTFLTGFYFVGHWGSTMTVMIVSIMLLLTGFYFHRVRTRFFLMITVLGAGIGP
jgi:MFS family permease